jgi:flagellar motor switch protein FliN/FliY
MAEEETENTEAAEATPEESADGEVAEGLNLDTVYDIPVVVSVVLGCTEMPISQLLKLGRGSVVELERKVGEAVDVFVNDRLVAKGEVVIVEDRIGISMTEVIKSDSKI